MKPRIHPVAFLIVSAAGMWLLARFVSSGHIAFRWRLPLAWLALLAGIALGGLGIHAFRKADTTVNPLRTGKASALVVHGAYRFSRNPMYLGELLLLLSLGLFLGSLPSLFMLPVFMVSMTRFQIVPEEQSLQEKFGASYREYCSRVRRWI